jgi:hypothetical protein
MRSTVLNLSQIQWFSVSLHIIALLSAAKSPSQWASCHRLPSPHTESEPPFPHAPPANRSPSQWAAPSTAAGDATYNNSQPQADPAGMENDQPTLWIYEPSSLGGFPFFLSYSFNMFQHMSTFPILVWHGLFDILGAHNIDDSPCTLVGAVVTGRLPRLSQALFRNDASIFFSH